MIRIFPGSSSTNGLLQFLIVGAGEDTQRAAAQPERVQKKISFSNQVLPEGLKSTVWLRRLSFSPSVPEIHSENGHDSGAPDRARRLMAGRGI